MRSSSVKWALLTLAGCSSTIAVSASRSILVPGADLTRTPICFVGPPDTALEACEAAASKRNVPVVPIAQGGCMVARMEWKAEQGGGRNAACDSHPEREECGAAAVYVKSLRLTLGEPAKAVESSARMYAGSEMLSEMDYQALCSAAFHDYPQPLSNERVNVEPR
jgi:hypothetical protein